jgi:glycosyltransferase involved in cell wall biosynthesis
MNFITLISDVDGAVDAFSEEESFRVDPRNAKEFSEKIIEATTLNSNIRRKIIDNNELTIEKFDFPKILKNFLEINKI